MDEHPDVVESAPFGYPCPACRAPADLTHGCSGCGRPPDPDAAEVIRLNGVVAELAAEAQRRREAHATAAARLAEVQRWRDEIAARVRAAVAVPEPDLRRPAAPPPAGLVPEGLGPTGSAAAPPTDPSPPPPPGPSSPGEPSPLPPPGSLPPPGTPPYVEPSAPGSLPPAGTPPYAGPPQRPEASAWGIQTLLFVIGGVLLGTGAVVFTVVAWTTLGTAGQAAILAAVTALALAAPVAARRRGLPGTAETFAVIAVLMVLLDGYAGWRAGLLAGLSDTASAGLVCGGTAAVALAYARGSRLASPRFAALALAQPVLPLLAAEPLRLLPSTGHRLAVIGYLLAALAAGNLATWWRLDRQRVGRAGSEPSDDRDVRDIEPIKKTRRALRVCATVATGGWLAGAALVAVVALAVGDGPALAALAGGALLAGAVVLAGLARVVGTDGWAATAAAVAVLAVALAAGRVVVLAWPGVALLAVTAVVTAVAAAVGAATVAARRTAPGKLAAWPQPPMQSVTLPQPHTQPATWPEPHLQPTAGPQSRTQPGVGPVVRGLRVGGLVAVGVVGGYVAALALSSAAVTAWLALTRAGALALPEPYDWQLPVAILLLTAALLALAPAARPETVIGGLALLALTAPPALVLPWWTAAAADLAVAAGLGLAATQARSTRRAMVAASTAATLAAHALVVGFATAAGTAAVLGALVLLGIAVAGRAQQRASAAAPAALSWVGRGAMLVGLLAWPGAAAATAVSAGVAEPWPARLALVAAAALLLAVMITQRAAPGQVPVAAGAVHAVTPVAIIAGLVEGVGTLGAYAGVAALVLAVLGLLRPPAQTRGWLAPPAPVAAPVPPPAHPGEGLAPRAPVAALVRPPATPVGWLAPRAPVAVLALAMVGPQLAAVLVGPYSWLDRAWSGTPADVGVLAGGGWPEAGAGAWGLLLLTVAAGLAGRVLAGRWRAGLWAGLLVAPAAVLVGLAQLGVAWPVVPAVSLLAGVAVVLLAALRLAGPGAGWLAGYGSVLVGAGVAGGLPLRWSTLVGLGVVLAVATVVGAAGRVVTGRVVGVVTAVAFGILLAVTATRAADLPLTAASFSVLAVSGAALAISAVLPARRAEAVAVEAAAHAGAVVALLLSVGSASQAATVAALWGVALGVRALRRGEPTDGRVGQRVPTGGQGVPAGGQVGQGVPTDDQVGRGVPAGGQLRREVPAGGQVGQGEPTGEQVGRAVAAGGCELLAWWLLLASQQVTTGEAYTLPAALGALGIGWWVRRTRPEVGSWLGYGPALAAAALPSLYLILVDPVPLRRLLLGAAAVAVVVAGARRRLQAPVVVGGVVAGLVALWELRLVWQLLDTWIPLTVAGLLLVGLAATYERRRRDLARLRATLRRMR